jgi:hypothetical protein
MRYLWRREDRCVGCTSDATVVRTTFTVNGATTVEDRRVVDHELGSMLAGVAF